MLHFNFYFIESRKITLNPQNRTNQTGLIIVLYYCSDDIIQESGLLNLQCLSIEDYTNLIKKEMNLIINIRITDFI